MTPSDSRHDEKYERFFGGRLGVRAVSVGNGESVMRVEIDPERHHNPGGVVHGGLIAALADEGMGAALVSTLEKDEFCATIELKVNYLQMVREGTLTGKTRVVKKGSRVAFLETQVFNGNNDLVAAASSSFILYRKTG